MCRRWSDGSYGAMAIWVAAPATMAAIPARPSDGVVAAEPGIAADRACAASISRATTTGMQRKAKSCRVGAGR
jgi:hypothetical protein